MLCILHDNIIIIHIHCTALIPEKCSELKLLYDKRLSFQFLCQTIINNSIKMNSNFNNYSLIKRIIQMIWFDAEVHEDMNSVIYFNQEQKIPREGADNSNLILFTHF